MLIFTQNALKIATRHPKTAQNDEYIRFLALFEVIFHREVCQLNMHLDVVIFTGKYHSLITEQIAALIVVGVLPVNQNHCLT